MNWRGAFFALFVFGLVPNTGFAQVAESEPLTGRLVISGSSTMAPLVVAISKLFGVRHPGVTVTVKTSASEQGAEDALEGKSDIGMASRDLEGKELALFAIPIARDGVALVVHKDNPAVGLTKAQIRDILTGKIANWRALAGPDAQIRVGTRTPGHSTLEIITHYLGIKPADIKADQVLDDNKDVLLFAAAQRGSFTFVSTGAVDHAIKNGVPIKPLSLDDVPPGSGSIRDGSWPLARPLNLLTRQVPAGLVKTFIEFALSPEVRQTIIDHEFVPFVE
jgi:phosphate transport system substrate-binding protein